MMDEKMDVTMAIESGLTVIGSRAIAWWMCEDGTTFEATMTPGQMKTLGKKIQVIIEG
jgi:hypothetical protein